MVPKVTMPFDQARKTLLNKMLAKSEAKDVVEKVIPFDNDDVPRFLEVLDKFEKRSEKVVVWAK